MSAPPTPVGDSPFGNGSAPAAPGRSGARLLRSSHVPPEDRPETARPDAFAVRERGLLPSSRSGLGSGFPVCLDLDFDLDLKGLGIVRDLANQVGRTVWMRGFG